MRAIDYSILPEHMRDAMQLYIEKGLRPGGFLTALLSNDLMGALKRADEVNSNSFRLYGMFLYNEAPLWCYGSPARVEAWLEKGGLEGSADVGA